MKYITRALTIASLIFQVAACHHSDDGQASIAESVPVVTVAEFRADKLNLKKAEDSLQEAGLVFNENKNFARTGDRNSHFRWKNGRSRHQETALDALQNYITTEQNFLNKYSQPYILQREDGHTDMKQPMSEPEILKHQDKLALATQTLDNIRSGSFTASAVTASNTEPHYWK